MNKKSAERTVMFMMMIVIIVGVVGRFGEGNIPRPRLLLAGVLATFGMLTLTSAAPKIGVGLAATALITALTTTGADAINKLGLSVNDPNATPKKRASTITKGQK